MTVSANTFLLINLSCACAVSAWFLHIYSGKRFLFVKPSIQVLVAMHVFLQWPLAVRSFVVFDFLSEPMHVWLLINVFMIVALYVSERTATSAAEELFIRIGEDQYNDSAERRQSLYFIWLLVAVIILAGFYLSQVQLSRLGLVVAFVDPGYATAAREVSFKLIDNPLVRYAFAMLTAVLIPMAAVLAAFRLQLSMKNKRYYPAIVYLATIIAFLVIVSLTGARYFSAAMILTIVLGFLLRQRFQIRIFRLFIFGGAALLPAFVLTLLRQGDIGEIMQLPAYLVEFVGYRVFSAPTDVCLWYMHFAQTMEPFGIGAIPKLAAVLGEPDIYSQNVIGSRYHITSLVSVHANGSFLCSYYGYFGLYAVAICLLLLLALDLLIPLLTRLDAQLLVPSMAAMATAALSFAQSDYTVSLLSHGYAAAPIVALMLSAWVAFWHGDRQNPASRIKEKG